MHDIVVLAHLQLATGPLGIYHNLGVSSTTPEGGTLVVKSSHQQLECSTKADSDSSAV